MLRPCIYAIISAVVLVLMSAAETVSDMITWVLIIFYVKYKKEKYNDDPES